MQLKMRYLKETKTCYVFQAGEPRSDGHITLYLKKPQVEAAGIDATKGITVMVEEGEA